jgi:hypothetical protein
MGADDARVHRAAELLSRMMSAEELSLLDGRVTSESLGWLLDAVPTAAASGLGGAMQRLEDALDTDPCAAVDGALRLGELAVACRLPQKLLLVLTALASLGLPLGRVQPALLLGAAALLAATPLAAVAWALHGAVPAMPTPATASAAKTMLQA